MTWKPGEYLRFFVSHKERFNLLEQNVEHSIDNSETLDPRSWRETEYSLGWLPLGGYCMCNVFASRTGEDGNEVYPSWDLRGKSKWKQLVITLAGPLANIVLAIVLFFAQSAVNEVSTRSSHPYHTPSEQVTSSTIAQRAIFNIEQSTVDVASNYVERPQEVVTQSGGMLSFIKAFPREWNISRLLYLSAICSLSIAIFNLLPLPCLDGGKAIIHLIEMATRRPLNDTLITWLNILTLLLIALWLLYLNLKDLIQLL